jgi:hypothetical protein
MGNKTNEYRVLVGRHERKGALEKPGHRWENNTNMNLRDVGWEM